VLFLPLYYVLLPITDSDYSFCVIFAIVLYPSDYRSDYSFGIFKIVVVVPLYMIPLNFGEHKIVIKYKILYFHFLYRSSKG
jgi:hypothetical protein